MHTSSHDPPWGICLLTPQIKCGKRFHGCNGWGVSLTAKLLPTQQWKMILYRYHKILVLQLHTSAKVGPGLATATFHGWVYKHYFKVASEDSKNLRVHCTLCGGSKTLSSARNSTSNFKKHLNTMHKSVKLVAKEVEF